MFAMRDAAGFTLIELMTAIALFAILTVLAVPMYSAFMANTQIRTATESMLAGVRLAQAEAVKRNGTVEFVLDEGTGWTVNALEGGDTIEVRKAEFKAGAQQSVVTPANGRHRLTFNGLGRVMNPNPSDGTLPLERVDVTSNVYDSPRNLRLIVGGAGKTYGIKMCDPALAKADPAGCP